MYHSDRRTSREFKLIVLQDLYRIRGYGQDHFELILDIGANIGIFSVYAKTMFPDARIVAVEPSHEALEMLKKNTALFEIEIDERALGTGEPLYQKDRTMLFNSRFVPQDVEGGGTYSVETASLEQIFTDHACFLSRPYLLKLDIEGGERYLLGHIGSETVLRHARQISMELHFRSLKYPYEHWLDFATYNDWIHALLDDTHDITYYCSSRHESYGHYYITRKA